MAMLRKNLKPLFEKVSRLPPPWYWVINTENLTNNELNKQKTLENSRSLISGLGFYTHLLLAFPNSNSSTSPDLSSLDKPEIIILASFYALTSIFIARDDVIGREQKRRQENLAEAKTQRGFNPWAYDYKS